MELRLRELVTSAQIAALLNGQVDLAFLRDGDPTEGIRITTLMKEMDVAGLPEAHALARRRTLSVKALEGDPFIMFARRMGRLPTTEPSPVASGVGFARHCRDAAVAHTGAA